MSAPDPFLLLLLLLLLMFGGALVIPGLVPLLVFVILAFDF